MDEGGKSNVTKGRTSFDSKIGDSLVTFLNRNITPYPTEAGGPKFDLVPVKQQKDLMLNVARMHAEQEYNRIMEMVHILQKQAEQIKRRLFITDAVHSASYNFQVFHGQCYWLFSNRSTNVISLSINGPNDWTCGAPEHYEYISRVRYMGDSTWIEVDDNGNLI
jgi:hypothetical protein